MIPFRAPTQTSQSTPCQYGSKSRFPGAPARFLCAVLSLTGCLAVQAAPATTSDKNDQIQPDSRGLHRCLASLSTKAGAQGIDKKTYARLTGSLEPDPTVLEKLDYQPEFVRPVWSYLAALVDDERIATGRSKLGQHGKTLADIEARYGVSKTTVLAIWGVESDFGKNLGTRPLLKSLATLSCFGRRQSYFSGEFIAALTIAARGDTQAEQLNGSWAGAFGHTQFMPSTFLRTAVDFNGDGRRDLVGSIPDALASTAQYLKKAGWKTGRPWGLEVELPANVIAHADSRTNRKPLSQWLELGVSAITPAGRQILKKLPANTRAAVIRPAITGGPAFMVFRNFDAIFAYNRSIKYALAIAHLGDRINGGKAFETAWPSKDLSLSRKQARELQTLLLLKGHDIGPVDGIIGPATRKAVRVEQERLGLPPTGHADQSILELIQPDQ